MFARRPLRTFTALPQCPEMSGFVRSSQRYPGYHHQPPVPTGLTAVSIVHPTGHTRHSPRTRSSSRPLRASRLVSHAPKATSSVFSAFYPNVRKCPVLSGLSKAIPVVTINILSQQDLHQFPSCSQPDIRLAAGVFRFRTPLFCRELAAPSSVAPAPALATPRVVQAYHCWYSGMWV